MYGIFAFREIKRSEFGAVFNIRAKRGADAIVCHAPSALSADVHPAKKAGKTPARV